MSGSDGEIYGRSRREDAHMEKGARRAEDARRRGEKRRRGSSFGRFWKEWCCGMGVLDDDDEE